MVIKDVVSILALALPPRLVSAGVMERQARLVAGGLV
jgi:hypothetical protein